ncbi:hypothetical protein PUN28_017836 [Cardiocondyla obscurior]|uniref:Reverse transcriptase domain-containing protein n=1 Tax=Cardiocondyla obscurior TaxID=286306 RepID=A0AAW2EN75_9HYME
MMAQTVTGVASPFRLKYVGPKNTKKPRMINQNPGPSGSRGPTLRSGSAGPSTLETAVSELACEFAGCERTFTTKTGRGLHYRKAHPDWYDERQNTTNIKARWNEEETLLLARKEVELIKQGGIRFMNQALLEVFPGRSLEAIKGKRRQADYKELVISMVHEQDSSDSTEEVGIEERNDEDYYCKAIADYIASLPAPSTEGFSSKKLISICETFAQKNKETVYQELTLYLQEIFPTKKLKHRKPDIGAKILSRKQARRAEYAKVQDLWQKNRNKCIRTLLDDISEVKTPSKEVMVPFWQTVMTSGEDVTPGCGKKRQEVKELWSPVTVEEIKNSKPANTTSAGPDGVTARLIKKMSNNLLARILNLIMWCGKAPTYLLQSITTLIPKKAKANLPADFRPITVSSVIIRTLHKVLATRMSNLLKFDQRQRAFRPTDGCSDNVFLLDLLLRFHSKNHKPLYTASIDIAKAFDSVSHNAIKDTLEMMGIPEPMIAYITNAYARSSTKLGCSQWTSESIQPTCGVKQGDPMSPVIFNMIIERLLIKLPNDIGARIDGIKVNAAAFADDMLLFSSTPTGLQKLLNVSVELLQQCGLKVNASKCFTVALRNVPHEKKTIVDKETVFECQGRILPALKRSDDWKYLGIPFTPEGRAKTNASGKLRDALEKLTKAPLKPQQRLFALRM